MRDVAGAVSGKRGGDSGMMRAGYTRSSDQNAASMMWQAMSPSEPVPKSHQPRHLNGAYAGLYGRSAAGPSHRFQSSESGTKNSSSGRSMPCGHHGRLVQKCTSRTV